MHIHYCESQGRIGQNPFDRHRPDKLTTDSIANPTTAYSCRVRRGGLSDIYLSESCEIAAAVAAENNGERDFEGERLLVPCL
jgi:hypothetical protein